MNTSVNQSLLHDSTLIWAIICSILLHGILAMVIPNLKFDEIVKPDTLTVDLVQKPEPPPVVVPPEPIPPPPEVIKPQPKPLPKPVTKPLPTPVVEKQTPVPEHSIPTPPPEVIAVAPKIEAPPPVQTVPVPVKEEPPPPAFSQADMDDARNHYGNSLWGAISKHKKYPKIAQMRGWEGEVIIELLVDGNGKLKSKKIAQSSGHEVLDKQAMEMVERALPFPVPPEALRNDSFTITVPVPFKLQNG